MGRWDVFFVNQWQLFAAFTKAVDGSIRGSPGEVGSLSRYLHGFFEIDFRWCRISSMNCIYWVVLLPSFLSPGTLNICRLGEPNV